jgi:hypothetical protein
MRDKERVLYTTLRLCAISTTAIDEITLRRRRANTAAITREGRTTAFRLTLIVPEHEQAVGPHFYFRTVKRFIGSSIPPVTYSIPSAQLDSIKGTYGLVRVLCTCCT